MAEEGKLRETEGSTATAALLLNDELHVAYVGDSAAVFVHSDTQSCVDLCPELDVAESNPLEVERVRKSDGVVLAVGKTMRVQGELALTRSLGALKYKPYVIATPHVHRYELKDELKEEGLFLVVASDGLWKVMKGEDVARIVSESSKGSEEEVARKLHHEAAQRNATDNITIVVVNIGKRQKLLLEETYEGSPVSK